MDPFPEEAYRAIFEASPDGVIVVDGEGVIRRVNPAAESLFGYCPGELTGELVEILVPESLREGHEEHRRQFVAYPRPRPMGIGMELAGRRKDGSEFPVEISLSSAAGDGGLLFVATVRDVTQRRQLKEFSTGALRASEEERQRIARELHDDTAQRLATLIIRLRLLQRAEDEQSREDHIEDLRRDLEEAADSVRRIARGLRPPELEDAGVGMALRAHARTLNEASGLRVDVEIEPVDHLLTSDAKLVLYRIIQEALSNVLRHSGATRSHVRVWEEDGNVQAVVEDEGKGFEPGSLRREGAGLGLIGMQERAVMIGGHVQIESSAGSGTQVKVSLPVDSVDEVERV